MRIIINMAGCAIHGRALEDAILMAILAGYSCMFAIKMEGELGVIYIGGFPAVRRMAGGAILSKLAVMEIIFLMAGIALLRRGLHVCDGAVIEMAVGAGCQSVLPNQIERDPVMVKV